MCGVLFEGDTRPFIEGQHVSMILRFKIGNEIEDVKIAAEIVRKNSRSIATQFSELPTAIEQTLHKVIDSAPDSQSQTAST
jgi:hypothetical protein